MICFSANGFITMFPDTVVKGDCEKRIHSNLAADFVEFRLILNFSIREKICKCIICCVTLLQP